MEDNRVKENLRETKSKRLGSRVNRWFKELICVDDIEEEEDAKGSVLDKVYKVSIGLGILASVVMVVCIGAEIKYIKQDIKKSSEEVSVIKVLDDNKLSKLNGVEVESTVENPSEFNQDGCIGSILSVGTADVQVLDTKRTPTGYNIVVAVRNGSKDRYIRFENDVEEYYMNYADDISDVLRVKDTNKEVYPSKIDRTKVVWVGDTQYITFYENTLERMHVIGIEVGEEKKLVNLDYRLKDNDILQYKIGEHRDEKELAKIGDKLSLGMQTLVIEGLYEFVDYKEGHIETFDGRNAYSVWMHINNQDRKTDTVYDKYKFFVEDEEGNIYEERYYGEAENAIGNRNNKVRSKRTIEGVVHFDVKDSEPKYLIIEKRDTGRLYKVKLELREGMEIEDIYNW